MAASFIGKPISLISHSDVRYRGILAGIDPAASTIQLSNVYSMGTESRRPPDQYIPPVQDPYAYIIFRAAEVKDLAVDEPQPRHRVHDDPAVLGVSAPMPQGSYGYPPGGASPQVQPAAQQQAQQQAVPPQQAPQAQNGAAAAAGQPQPATKNGVPRAASSAAVQNATASMESVERALGDLRVSDGPAPQQQQQRGGGVRRGGGGGGRGQQQERHDIRVPNTDFDFQSSNARFDKAALSPHGTPKGDGTPSEGEDTKSKDKEVAYDPKKSFFDSLSSGSNATAEPRGGGRGGRRGGGGRNRREEERERNVATFGEPGGVGLMGPGAYVGGWGGYGRRGNGRGRRGQGPAIGAR